MSGVRGVAVDVWWGAVERKARQYVWGGYKQLVEVVKSFGLKLQVVMSFHACGGNVGDSAQIPLPPWVLQAGEHDPDLFFTDRPRSSGRGQRNKEYLSIFADDAPGALQGRTPLQCYEDFMVAFRDAFADEIGSVIEEIVVGAGPCGELRYPSYVEANGWRFPGIGEFQCYDRRALASLAQAARQIGRPEWGNSGPCNAGHYNSKPEDTEFFSRDGAWDTAYGRFFMDWYSGSLLQHGERLLAAASRTFQHKPIAAALGDRNSVGDCCAQLHAAAQPLTHQLSLPVPMYQGMYGSKAVTMSDAGELDIDPSLGDLTPRAHISSARFGFSSSALADNTDGPAATARLASSISTSSVSTECNWAYYGTADVYEESESGFMQDEDGGDACISRAMSLNDCSSPAHSRRSSQDRRSGPAPATPPRNDQVLLTLKVAGIHWWSRSPSHAAELTAGYYNTDTHDGYRPIVELCARYGANLTLTCVEMCDQQHPREAMCGPEGILRQARAAAALYGVQLSGENALPIFLADGIDTVALDRVVQNTAATPPPGLQGLYCAIGSSPAVGNIVAADRQFLGHMKPVHQRESPVQNTLVEAFDWPLPAMRAFTFLRLGPELLTQSYSSQWLRFMRKMLGQTTREV